MTMPTPPPKDPADPMVGRTVAGKYRIMRPIAHGAIGPVYLARATTPPGEVVVKLLRPELAGSADIRERFEIEVRRRQSVQHPNIAEVLDAGTEDDHPFVVMEYVSGELLCDYVTRLSRLPLRHFVPIAAQILKAVGHAHSRELSVAGIRPGSVMLTTHKGRANFVKLLDFGLAERLDVEHRAGPAGKDTIMAYLAPEVIRGQPFDLRSDVYAIGILFYYMLSGAPPFAGNDAQAIGRMILHDPAPYLGAVLGPEHGISPRLFDLIHSCIHKDASRRPGDADHIVEALIDVVPASLFRLPRSEPEPGTPQSVSTGASGLLDLFGSNPPSGGPTESRPPVGLDANSSPLRTQHSPITALLAAPILAPQTNPIPAPAPPPSASPPPRPVPPPVAPPQPTPWISTPAPASGPRYGRLLGVSAVAGAAVMAVILLVALTKDHGTDSAPPTRDKFIAPANGIADPSRALESIEAMVQRGEIDAAAAALADLPPALTEDPALGHRITAVSTQVRARKLIQRGHDLEKSGDREGAIASYREVLAIDPEHEGAAAAVDRLAAPSQQPEPSLSTLVITSEPTADLQIDGTAAGTTPFAGELPLGLHRVRLSAPGFHSWETSVELTHEAHLPIAVNLRLKSTPAPSPQAAAATPAAAPAQPPAGPPPASTPPIPPDGATTTNGPFLPTKKPAAGGVFLPTDKPK